MNKLKSNPNEKRSITDGNNSKKNPKLKFQIESQQRCKANAKKYMMDIKKFKIVEQICSTYMSNVN